MWCSAQEGTLAAGTAVLDEATEKRVEALVAERVRAKLVESMRKARDHGRQKVC